MDDGVVFWGLERGERLLGLMGLQDRAFYEQHGYALIPDDECDRVLRHYWSLPERQIETSVVLASSAWWVSAARRAHTAQH